MITQFGRFKLKLASNADRTAALPVSCSKLFSRKSVLAGSIDELSKTPVWKAASIEV